MKPVVLMLSVFLMTTYALSATPADQQEIRSLQAEVAQLKTEVQQLKSQNAQLTAAAKQPPAKQPPADKPSPVSTTQGDAIENVLNAVPAESVPQASDTPPQCNDKIAKIKSYLTGKLVGKTVRISSKLDTANISLTTKQHLYVELEPLAGKDFTWKLQGFYLPPSLTQKFTAMHVGDTVEVDAEIAKCDVKDISGTGAAHLVLELTLAFKAVDAHKAGQ